MSLYERPFPWLDKARAVTRRHRPDRPERTSCADRHARGARPGADLGTSLRALVLQRARLPTGSFVFVVSDFLGELDPRHWVRLRARAWDVTPVVVQDPTWEQSFPPVGGIAIPFVAADGGEISEAWLHASGGDALPGGERGPVPVAARPLSAARARPRVIDSSDPDVVLGAFLDWAARRHRLRRRAT